MEFVIEISVNFVKNSWMDFFEFCEKAYKIVL